MWSISIHTPRLVQYRVGAEHIAGIIAGLLSMPRGSSRAGPPPLLEDLDVRTYKNVSERTSASPWCWFLPPFVPFVPSGLDYTSNEMRKERRGFGIGFSAYLISVLG